MRPLIGITTYVEEASWGVWHCPAALVPQAYVRAVEAAGGRALLVPPSEYGAAETIAVLDGLILAGGADIDPAQYGAAPSPATTGTRPDRDAGELALLRLALEDDLPIFGICRGMQLMNVAHGGRLSQHLPDVVGHDDHRAIVGEYHSHDVAVRPDSLVGQAIGTQASVPSYHHQGIAEVGTGLHASAHAPDGTVEAIEVDGRAFAVGVLWHPEVGDDPRLFEALVQMARAARATRA